MTNRGAAHVRLALLLAAVFLAPQTYPQPSPQTGPAGEASPMFQRHKAMAGIMKDLVEEMARMQEQMGAGVAKPEMRKQMALNMRRMSEMMQRMSGLAEYANMSEPEFHRQLEEMRRQMDEMLKAHRVKSPANAK